MLDAIYKCAQFTHFMLKFHLFFYDDPVNRQSRTQRQYYWTVCFSYIITLNTRYTNAEMNIKGQSTCARRQDFWLSPCSTLISHTELSTLQAIMIDKSTHDFRSVDCSNHWILLLACEWRALGHSKTLEVFQDGHETDHRSESTHRTQRQPHRKMSTIWLEVINHIKSVRILQHKRYQQQSIK